MATPRRPPTSIRSWIGTQADTLFADALGRPLIVGNDADAAGLAEMRFGAGRGEAGTVLMLTLGTGIGSALFRDGDLVPNTELGHLQIRGKDAERRAAASIKERKGLSWQAWSKLPVGVPRGHRRAALARSRDHRRWHQQARRPLHQ